MNGGTGNRRWEEAGQWAETGLAHFFYVQPVWVQGLVVFLLLLLAYLAGWRIQRLLLREPCTDAEASLVGSALALLAFLIGFTFSIAINRYDERRALVLAEANAIGTSWLRAGLAPEPMQGEMRQILRRYIDLRVEQFDAGERPEDLRPLQQASQEELALLWEVTARAAAVIEPAPLATTLVQTVNETIDLAESRRTTYLQRIPRIALFAVIGFALVTTALSGLVRGGRRHFLFSALTSAMTAGVIALILDLDRPLAGSIRLQPGPLLETLEMMQSSPAGPATGPQARGCRSRRNGLSGCATAPASRGRARRASAGTSGLPSAPS